MDHNKATDLNPPRRNILVTGATGKQGTALIKALLLPNTPTKEYKYHIYALTRKSSSPGAARLVAEENVTLVEGDLDDPPSMSKIFEEANHHGRIWGVFAVLAYPGLGANADGEEKQGKMLADLALQYSVEIFVYSSQARSGPKYEPELKLSQAAKREVESYCKQLGEKGLNWVIIRPGFFMENFDNFIGSIAVSVLKTGLGKGTEIGLIAAKDIGHVAAGVFREPDKYKHQILVAIGNYQTMSQMEDSYESATEHAIPSVPKAMAWFITKTNKSTQEVIGDLERHHHARTAGEYPELEEELRLANEAFRMRSYYEWVKQGKQDAVKKEGWNNLSVGKLLTGRF